MHDGFYLQQQVEKFYIINLKDIFLLQDRSSILHAVCYFNSTYLLNIEIFEIFIYGAGAAPPKGYDTLYVENLFSKHRPSGPMIAISRNVSLRVRVSVCPSVCPCVHF